VLAAKLTDREHTQIAEPRPADVPDDEVMEAAGAVIGKIDIDIRNIFDQRYGLERNFFLSGINIAAPGTPATVGVRLSLKY